MYAFPEQTVTTDLATLYPSDDDNPYLKIVSQSSDVYLAVASMRSVMKKE
jgi:hypothetical protein